MLLTLSEWLTAIDINRAGIRLQNATQNLDQRGLARAIWADTPNQCTGGNLKGHIP
jgi:hypothetical protein